MFNSDKTLFKGRLSSYLLLIVCFFAISAILFWYSIELFLIFLAGIGVAIILLSIFYPEVLLLLTIRARRIERYRAPALYDKIEEMCSKAGVTSHKILVVPNSGIDVYSVSGRNKNFLVFTPKALDSIGEPDMDMVLRAELVRTKSSGGSLNSIPNHILIAISRSLDMVVAVRLRMKGVSIKESIEGDGYHIRAATGDDVMDIFRYYQSAFTDHTISLHQCVRLALGNTSLSLVVERDGKFVGFLTGRIKLNQSGMYGRGDIMVIDDKHRRHGLGKRLLSALITAFREAGCRYIISETAVDNMKSLGMQEGLGFRRIGIKKDFYSVGADAIIMTMRLK